MPTALFRLTFAACCLLLATPVLAITVTKVDVRVSGQGDDALADNVRSALALNEEVGKVLSARRLNYLLREAEAETRQALEPFGYYSPTITIQRSDRSMAEDVDDRDRDADKRDADAGGVALEAGAENDNVERDRRDRTLTVSIRVEPGTPVRIRDFVLSMDGAAERDASVQSALSAFVPRKGDVLDHTRYDASKADINRALAAHGYFDAKLPAHRVEVTRADFAADIDLRWTSGARFKLGEARFRRFDRVETHVKGTTDVVHFVAGVVKFGLKRCLATLQHFEFGDSLCGFREGV